MHRGCTVHHQAVHLERNGLPPPVELLVSGAVRLTVDGLPPAVILARPAEHPRMAQPSPAFAGFPGRTADTGSPPDQHPARTQLVTERTARRPVLEQIGGHHPIVRGHNKRTPPERGPVERSGLRLGHAAVNDQVEIGERGRIERRPGGGQLRRGLGDRHADRQRVHQVEARRLGGRLGDLAVPCRQDRPDVSVSVISRRYGRVLHRVLLPPPRPPEIHFTATELLWPYQAAFNRNPRPYCADCARRHRAWEPGSRSPTSLNFSPVRPGVWGAPQRIPSPTHRVDALNQ